MKGLLNCISMTLLFSLSAQKNLTPVACSEFTGLEFNGRPLKDTRSFFVGLAKTTLELETGPDTVSDLEVFVWPNRGGLKSDSELWLNSVIHNLDSLGWKLRTSERDHSFMYLEKVVQHLIMYYAPGKNEANVYFGKLNIPETPEIPVQDEAFSVTEPDTVITTVVFSNSNASLVGKWGTLAGAKVNRQDSSTGYMVVSGVSKGFGLEFRQDGTFLHVTVVTSGRPNYRVFVTTEGKWSAIAGEVNFYPTDRHYRKWENEIIMADEHSVPDPYMMYWRKGENIYTGESCLYVRYPDEKQERELCSE
ncbi:hypothetical protein SAMN06265375_1048 [Muriicola jejuensis]|uniref:Uncharacterized protein n=1 Tax=Muriicola jejuensis TaxID=504488 RepID=A0A6P0UIV1_9FLAO|nr:hypothetical protein [Muriicola jejuensis]NER11023.1 hypothetical protein [Muriicola jejuensis]SMP22888.1 hypothetical protein SAMN06265375_1048 [Muriicola jejuensis]